MKSTFRVLFYLRKDRINKQGLAPIFIRITINKDMTQFNSKLEVNPDPNIWNTKLGRAIGRSAEITNLNRLLGNIQTKIESIYNKQMDTKGYVLPETIKNILLGINSDRKSFIEYFALHNEQYKLKVDITTSQKTYSRYELTKSKLLEFMRQKYNISDIMSDDINYLFIESFYLYLRETTCNNNTAMKFIQRLRTVFNFAINCGVEIKVNPFSNFKFKYDTVYREILTQEEIDTIYNKEFTSKRLSQVRDLFIFCCYTGLAYVDVCKLTEQNLMMAFDKHLWITTKRTKTGVASNIRLLDIPKEIIEKYRGKDKTGKLIPSCSNQKMNEYLKETADI